MRSGFRIGFNPTQQLQRSSKNMLSAHAHPEVVSEQFSKDCKKGYTLGPLHPADFPQVHTSRIGVIPKKYQEGKWRLIVDLSAPRGKSVNDGIKRELCSLHYVKVDDIVNQVLQMGRGTLLAKLDVKSAFRIVPVHPADRHLLGMEWEGQLYIDNSLPFGLRSAPKIFNAIADALEWILRQHGVSNIWHYLDDFLVAGTRSSGECARYLHTVIRLCQILGIPLAEEKLAGPATVLAILGIEFDTDRLMLRLPKEKFQRLKQMLAEWASKRSCTRKELQSLIGQLQHASTIVKPGRTFLRRMYDLLSMASLPHHHIRLSGAFKSDLAWWSMFLNAWKGSAMMSPTQTAPPTAVVTSDASGSWGCGAYCNHQWFQLAWPDESTAKQAITLKELAPIVLAAAVWGSQWRSSTVLCRTDNAAVVDILRSRTSKCKETMHLLRCLHFYEAFLECTITAEHLPGEENDRADDLSRNRLFSFLQKTPEASRTPTPIPQPLLELLFTKRPDWLSREWKALFKDSLITH